MKIPSLAAACALAALVFLSGCGTRSISNSDYPERSNRYGRRPDNGYRGELAEVDVLGVDTTRAIAEGDIVSALENAGDARLVRGGRLLLIQSGAPRPDAEMSEAMGRYFTVAEFSGVPADAGMSRGASYNKQLRLMAGHGGYDKIVCYWGVPESARENKVTKAVSWVPILGGAVPDERQTMRIRLRAAIIDVRTNNWTMVTPPPVKSGDSSSGYTRKATDQGLVNELKARGCQELAKTLADSHAAAAGK
ncbi:MAG: hypothetical protein LBC18_03620 [Opitutaceae bacterium]|jgi:hypothetical protein|nr:hypothetical protein [Opitutaceae bacterium]